ncbi:MAG TPA: hypothetical protein VEU96_07765 [Bryobacteraceae bacterium]|nr:hypothetical protein [Bryobacteraceae bacterium]
MALRSSFGTAAMLENRPVLTLPPLILHPFADAGGPNKLVESSRASLKLQGLLPTGESSREDLDRALLDGRYSELRMLYYVGKDLARWIDQCVEFADHNREQLPTGITFQSFAAMLVQDAPANIQEKLRKWGVADFKSIFTRALGLQYVFAAAPARELLCDDFLRNYFKFADQMFAVKQGEREFTPLAASDFQFDLYSSGEYSRMLEKVWGE